MTSISNKVQDSFKLLVVNDLEEKKEEKKEENLRWINESLLNPNLSKAAKENLLFSKRIYTDPNIVETIQCLFRAVAR